MVKKDKVRLGDVCTIVSGTTPKTGTKEYWDGELNWITPAELSDDIDIIYKTERKITNKAVTDSSLKLLPVGTVLLSSRAPIGKVAIVGSPMYCNQGFKNLICSNSIFNKFLYWFLKGKKDFLNSLGRGATFKEISKFIVEDIQISLPSLSEQKRIAAILDKATELIALRKQQIGKLDLLVKSRFIEMFGDPINNPYSWPTSRLEPHIEFLTSGSRGWSQYFSEKGEVFITIKNVKNSKIILDEVQYVLPPQNAEAMRTKVQQGDLLISITADLGRTGVVSKSLAEMGAYINQHLTCIRLNKCILTPFFVSYYMESSAGKKQFAEKNQNGVKAGLNFDAIKSLRLFIPPFPLQEEFETFVSQVDKSKSTLQQSLEKLELNYKALMQTYFG